MGTIAFCLRGAYFPIKLSFTCIGGSDKSGRKDLKFLNKWQQLRTKCIFIKPIMKVLYPKFSYSHHKNILSLPQLLYMYVLQLLTLNFGTVLKLDKQNKLKTSEIKLHLATTEQAATSMFLRRPCRPRMRALRCLLTIGTGSAYPVWRNASTKAKKRENQRLGNMTSSCKFLIKNLQLYRGPYITPHFPRPKISTLNGFVINYFQNIFGWFSFLTKTASEKKSVQNVNRSKYLLYSINLFIYFKVLRSSVWSDL